MKHPVVVVTGTDTGVGKTVLTCLMAGHWAALGLRVAALKPVCAGGREDALALQAALGGALELDRINPWHFRAPLAPLAAARLERRRVRLAEVLAHVRNVRQEFDLTLIEGAGGLLSPLGEDFNTGDLIRALRAFPVVVCPDRLGAVNQALLVLGALPGGQRSRAPLVLVRQPQADPAGPSNARVLGECLGTGRLHSLPWLAGWKSRQEAGRVVQVLCKGILLRFLVRPGRRLTT